MSSVAFGVLVIILLLIFMLMRIMPIGTAMAFLGLVGYGYLISAKGASYMFVTDFFRTFSLYSFSVIPMFIFMGQVLFNAGIGQRLYRVANKWLGNFPGGLAIATIVGCGGFAAISGSAIATAATIGTVAHSEMKRFNYSPALATGCVASGGTLGVLIPPSVTFIVYGFLVEESIGKLFIAGILPGILLMCLFIATIIIQATFNKSLCPPTNEKFTWAERFRSLRDVTETLLLFVLIMGGLFAGFFTPTEAAGVGACGALIIVLATGQIGIRGIIESFFQTLRSGCMVLVIIAGATVFNHFLAVTKIPFILASFVSGLPISPILIMAIICVMYIIGGCIMEALPLILLTVPIFFPVVTSLGYDPIWFGVLIVLLGQIGMITPPVGVNVFVIAGVTNVPLQTVFRGVVPFVLAMIVGVILIMAFPEIALWLPRLMG